MTDPDIAQIGANIKRRKDPNSEAARFDKALSKQKAAEIAERSTLEEMLGATPQPFTRQRDTDDSEITFYPRPPKIGTLSEILFNLSYQEGDMVGMIVALSTVFLYVIDPKTKQKRRATAFEIGTSLEIGDLELLKGMCERYLNVTLDEGKPQGNV